MSTLETNLVQPATGTTLTLGASGDTITIPSGVTISNSGTASGFGKVLQAVTNSYTGSEESTSSNTFQASSVSVDITPLSIEVKTVDVDGVYEPETTLATKRDSPPSTK